MAGIGIPVYKKIQSSIRKKIQTLELRPGDPVASERELARTHNVSLMTARHALAGLEREGIVERRQGAGTFVAPPKIHFNKLTSYSEQMLSRGLPPRSRVLSAKIIEHETEIAARLRLPPHSNLVKIERVREANNEPMAFEICYLPASQFADLVRAPLGKNSLFAILNQRFGVELTYADEEVDATASEKKVAELLGISPGEPVLRIRQLIYSTQGKPVIYAQGLYRAECHTLFVRRFR